MRMHVEHKGKQKEQRVSAPSAEPMNDAAQDAAFRKPDSIAFSGAALSLWLRRSVSPGAASGPARASERVGSIGTAYLQRHYVRPLPAHLAARAESRSRHGAMSRESAFVRVRSALS